VLDSDGASSRTKCEVHRIFKMSQRSNAITYIERSPLSWDSIQATGPSPDAFVRRDAVRDDHHGEPRRRGHIVPSLCNQPCRVLPRERPTDTRRCRNARAVERLDIDPGDRSRQIDGADCSAAWVDRRGGSEGKVHAHTGRHHTTPHHTTPHHTTPHHTHLCSEPIDSSDFPLVHWAVGSDWQLVADREHLESERCA
jgi:hypothetical protein